MTMQWKDAPAETVATFLEWDHRRLDALLPNTRALAAAGDFDEAQATFAQFRSGLARHIQMEERVLFPVVEDGIGGPAGPTQVMRHEHRAIESQMTDIATALEETDLAAFEEGLSSLSSVLAPHNMKEENILYPMADQFLGSAERRSALVRSMQAI